ncbi:type IV pilus modification PilV family protein [Candidatus Pelagibacter sp. HIMB1485]|uniref:type IV pilus modification PilV family protein n=1 Tax=Candidatus Pelagibacter sp. HIMB1485 TaxID=3415415 RepID=UPI003F84B556
MNLKYKFQRGVSLVEGMTAAGVLGIAITVFMTLQSYQERDFANLRKFDKAAYAVELMFEELAAVYNPVAAQYGNPQVFEDTTAGASLKVKGLAQLPGDGDQIIIEGVGGKYEITDSTDFDDDNNTTLSLERSDVPDDTPNKNMASDATANSPITFISNAEGSLDPYNDLDMTKFEDPVYIAEKTNLKVRADLDNWGALLKKHLGPARTGDKRLIEVEDIERDVPVDKDNDGVTDQVDGVDVYETVKKKQVTIIIKQDKIQEKFRRLFLAGT